MFRKIEDFLGNWSYEADATAKLLDSLTDDSLKQQVSPEGRTLGRIAWHIVQSIPEMGSRTGLRVTGPSEEEPIPASASEIATRYRAAADSLAEEVRARWTDADLEVEDDMYGEQWARGRTLAVVAIHQTHHRGQMTVLMRQAGLPVHGVYGPSREEWAAYGMPPQK
jgi:uncharacterized damage-inducible protein DinB